MKTLKILLCLTLCFAMLSSAAFAQGISVDASFNGTTVTLEGTTVGNTIVKILPFGMSQSSLNASTPPVDIDFFTQNGDYTYEFTMPHTAPSGKYSAYVINSADSAADSFIYYIPANAVGLLAQIKSAATDDIMYDLISSSAADLGIDKDEADYIAYGKRSCEILHKAGIEPNDVPEFNDIFYAGIALAAMEGKASDAVYSYFTSYEDNLKLDVSAVYDTNTSLTDGMKTDILYLLAHTDFGAELKSIKETYGSVDFAKLYDRLVALSAVRNAGGWMNLKKIYLTDYNSILGTIITSNSSYKSEKADAVFEELGDEKYVFAKFADLKTNFNSAVKLIFPPSAGDKKDPVVLPGSSSSSSSSTGSFQTSSGAINKNDDYEQGSVTSPDASQNKATTYSIPTLGGAGAQYLDLPQTHWAAESISTLGASGIISGYEDGSFRPDSSISRAEFAKLIVSAFSVDAAANMEFGDVAETDWFAPYVVKAAGSGLINGYNGMFTPNGNISRQDAALILYRMAALAGVTYTGTASFDDITDISVYALTAVRSLANAGIISGDSYYRFNPHNELTRAEAAKLLCSLIKNITTKLNEGGK